MANPDAIDQLRAVLQRTGSLTADDIPIEALEAFNAHWCANEVYDWPESSIAHAKAGIAAAINAVGGIIDPEQ